MNTDLLKVSIRQGAVYIPHGQILATNKNISGDTLGFLANIKNLGYTVSEELLQALDRVAPTDKLQIFDLLSEITGAKLNWTPLVKGWDVPTGESPLDHIITFFANLFKSDKGTRLACGHLIPDGTFPLERYNGCPYCGTPFQFGEIENYGQGSKLKVLELWTEEQLSGFFRSLLESRTVLDATQVDSLKILVDKLPLPDASIGMKETMMVVVDALVAKGEPEKAQPYFATPTDVLRYLWYKKTGFLQIVEPRTIIRRNAANHTHITAPLNRSAQAALAGKEALKLKYSRPQCRVVAQWLNELDISAEKACEAMHPKRAMWVRFIRALRLAEYARKEGFERLKRLMDVFYNQSYDVWQGEVDRNKLRRDAPQTFALLKQRPGLFARSLFANMLWFGADVTLEAFAHVAGQLPARLLLTLNMYAPNYFDRRQTRSVRPLGGTTKVVPANKFLALYTDAQLKEMVNRVEELCLDVMTQRFARLSTESKTMYIDPTLYHIPLSIGDRSETIQDASSALMGTRFPVAGNAVRLFMQWGKGLPAQPLDMDLSACIAYEEWSEICAYYHLVATGAKHSGDIRNIPDRIGTAEYIELDLDELTNAGAKYVAFTCNAYSNGALSPNLVVGWMDSAYPMKISEKSGVAYDPSCVQHQVRVAQGLTKGLVFGVLNVLSREIIWLEMPFGGQLAANMNAATLEAQLKKLDSKTTIGRLLALKAKAQHLELTDSPQADEAYTIEWARNTAEVTKLLVD